MNDLEMYREQLALCDDKIIDALVERSSIIEKIMAYKEEYGMPILQPQQEEKQKKRLEEKLSDNRYKEEIFDVFGCILRNSKRIQARKLFSYNIVLIGFMGAGKSTIAKVLKEKLNVPLCEMDEMIAEQQKMAISDIFAQYGETHFRDLETQLVKDISEKDGVIVSCGGGAVLREENVSFMKENGRIVLLSATPETIYERVRYSKDRPILNGHMNVEYIRELMEKPKGIISLGAKMGEGWLLTAEMIELVEGGYENIVCAQPFGCLPNHIVGKGMINQIRARYPQANITPVDYDPSATRVNQENRIKLMLAVAKERLNAPAEAKPLTAEEIAGGAPKVASRPLP